MSIGGVSAVTVTASDTVFSFSVKFVARSSPSVTVTSFSASFLKPDIVTVIVYGPPTRTFRIE